MSVSVSAEQLVGKPKEIGTYKGHPVLECATKGGFHMVLDSKGKPLGTGSHRAIARRVAMRENPGMVITALAKSEDMPEWLIEQEVPYYTQLTKYIQTEIVPE